jgi:hypothetical protein
MQQPTAAGRKTGCGKKATPVARFVASFPSTCHSPNHLGGVFATTWQKGRIKSATSSTNCRETVPWKALPAANQYGVSCSSSVSVTTFDSES